MARYIDADKLLKNLPDDLPYKASVKRVLIQAPTCDVVPKSEVEKVVAQISKQEMDSYEHIYKQEVAREIFEEIEENLVNANFITGNVELNFGYYLMLKKKYTESEDKG